MFLLEVVGLPHHYFRFGPFGFDVWGAEWWMPSWVDVERTADEVILTLKIPRDIKKGDCLIYRNAKTAFTRAADTAGTNARTTYGENINILDKKHI
jgi:hypothetical protein